uniref:ROTUNDIFOLIA 3 family protein n=1 Tax=Rhizophora mucronata TaxID=61149 RepID=A0A2P2MPX5_RHIMU
MAIQVATRDSYRQLLLHFDSWKIDNLVLLGYPSVASYKVVKEDGNFKPGQFQTRAQPLSTTKRCKTIAHNSTSCFL